MTYTVSSGTLNLTQPTNHYQPSGLVQCSSVWHVNRSHLSAADGAEHCRLSGRWCWQLRAHYASHLELGAGMTVLCLH